MRNISHSKCQYSAQQDFYLVVMLCIYTTMYLLLLILCKCGKSKIRYFFSFPFFRERAEDFFFQNAVFSLYGFIELKRSSFFCEKVASNINLL